MDSTSSQFNSTSQFTCLKNGVSISCLDISLQRDEFFLYVAAALSSSSFHEIEWYLGK